MATVGEQQQEGAVQGLFAAWNWVDSQWSPIFPNCGLALDDPHELEALCYHELEAAQQLSLVCEGIHTGRR